MISSTDVGRRVVVRQYVGTGAHGRPQFTDLLGELLAAGPEDLTIRTADGIEHTVPRSEIAAAKPVPPRPTPYSEIVALELAAATTWPAPVQHHLGEWLLRAGDGWTARANSALPLGDPGRPLAAAIDEVEAWYSGQGLRPAISTPLPVCRRVHDALLARGWTAWPTTLTQVAPLSGALVTPPRPVRAGNPPVEIRLAELPSQPWLTMVAGRKGDLPAAGRHILTAVDQVRFAEAYAAVPPAAGAPESGAPKGGVGGGGAVTDGPLPDGGQRTLVALARGAISSDGEWLGLSLIEVARGFRRRGLAHRVIRELAGWASHLGVQRAFLQVTESNEAAQALYARLGFTTHHRYVTFSLDP